MLVLVMWEAGWGERAGWAGGMGMVKMQGCGCCACRGWLAWERSRVGEGGVRCVGDGPGELALRGARLVRVGGFYTPAVCISSNT